MNKLLFTLWCSFLFVYTCSVTAQYSTSPVLSVNTYNKKLQTTPLLFSENKGQVVDASGTPRPDILFTAHSGGAKIFVTAGSIHYQFEKQTFPDGYEANERQVTNQELQNALRKRIQTETYHFILSLNGANPSPKVRKEAQSSFTENFYLAHCPNGITGVHTFSRVVMEEIYPGIDWVIYSKEQGLEYDFVVHPGSDASLIQLKADEAQSVRINEKGELVMTTPLGEVKEKRPVSFCEGKTVATAFKQNKDGTIRFAIDAWDKSKTLIIDPTVSWATYYGGSDGEVGHACTVDSSGNVYMAGWTYSSAGIALDGFQSTFGGPINDAFLVKFNSSGARLWATYYGGSSDDDGYSCAIDRLGNVYLAGWTSSSNGIASGGFKNTYSAGYDAFLVKFNSSGARLWATYYGGTGRESGEVCAIDTSGNVYLAGETSSNTDIAFNGFQNTREGGSDAYLVKFNSSGTRLWATYYGGADVDGFFNCFVDRFNNLFLAGWTTSISGVSFNGFQNTYGGGTQDAMLVKFDSIGVRLWATYYGGSGYDVGYSCTVDSTGNVYMCGSTDSASLITFNGFQNTYGGGNLDAYLVKFNNNGTRLWATYYGGGGYDIGSSCTVDGSGNIFIAGVTGSTSGIASNGYQNTFGGGSVSDGFLVKFSSNGGRLWGTYYGGGSNDIGQYCTVDRFGFIYLIGNTGSASGIAVNGFQNIMAGSNDAFLAKFIDNSLLPLKLLQFTAEKIALINRISWQTAAETPGARFEVERSADGRSFHSLSSAAGRNLSGAAYIFYDHVPLSPISYYRLKNVEQDATITYSAIVAVRSNGKVSITATPLPAKSRVTISNTGVALIGTRAEVVDMKGREVYRFVLSAVSFIDVSRWSAGMYLLRLADGSTLRLVKE